MKEKIHFYDLDVFLELPNSSRLQIQNKMKRKNISLRRLEKLTGSPRQSISPFIFKNKATKSKTVLKVLNALKLRPDDIENHKLTVYTNPYKNRKVTFKFPIIYTPLHTRLLAHIIGDSALEKNSCRWYQKNIEGLQALSKLIKNLININTKIIKDTCGIPFLLIKIICSVLDINITDIKKCAYVSSIAELSKDHKIQFLSGIIVDEGSIRKSTINITNTNYNLLRGLVKILDSLSYSHSGIKRVKNCEIGKKIWIKNKECKINFQQYILTVHADSIFKLNKELKKHIQKYGKVAGLWHKQHALNHWAKKVDINYIHKARKTKRHIIPKIFQLVEQKPYKVGEIAQILDISYIRAYKILYRLKNRGEIKKCSAGIFSSNNFEGPYQKTIWEKILPIIKERPINIKEIPREIEETPKSVSALLTKLNKKGVIKRLERGIYIIS